ncbi:hypothetical protein J4449_04850 [Candidatus Woesearchaeota archaeon]|nr:hypothetical protein [Candidatus Woesearchaeota archaeon]
MEEKEIRARLIIEVVGLPKEHVSETLNKLIEKIRDDNVLILEKQEIFEPVELQDMKLFSSFVEADIKFPGIDKLVGFCFDFTPSSVEILEPMSFIFDAKFLNSMLNDFITKLHRYTMLIRNLDAEYALLKKEVDNEKQQPIN